MTAPVSHPNEPHRRTPAAHPTRVSDVVGLAVIPVWSLTEPNYAGLLGLSQWRAYEHARRSVVETISLLDRRKAVLVAPLLRRLGVEDSGESRQPADEQRAAAGGHVQ